MDARDYISVEVFVESELGDIVNMIFQQWCLGTSHDIQNPKSWNEFLDSDAYKAYSDTIRRYTPHEG